jgi:ABC-type lipoprotein release transport system permease subunit
MAGTLAGVILGTAAAVLLEKFGLVPLPAQLYGMGHAPFRVDALDVLVVGILSVLWSFVAAAIPARTAARQPAVEALRGA